jgi:hypothetical protein
VPGGVYLIQKDDQLVEMTEQPYDSEDLLQGLLAQHPNLLAGDQIDSDEPRRWLLVSRELALASEEDGSGRWSVDHLFLDQDAIPTIVEVKRSTDTRIRRQVVGQMLDYAANAVVYWPVEALRSQFEAACEAEDLDPERELAGLLGVDADHAEFWLKAKTNLQAGRVRLIFVADEIPSELRRVVEFLNEQMDPAEVLAIEIKQYAGQGMKTLVPRVVGQKIPPPLLPSRQWSETSFFEELEKKHGAETAAIDRRILEWGNRKTPEIWWGKGKFDGSFVPTLTHKGVRHQLLAVWTYGVVEIYFYWFAYKPPFSSEEKRKELLDRLNSIPGVSLPQDAITRRPTIPLSTFGDEAALRQLLETYDWVIEEIKES